MGERTTPRPDVRRWRDTAGLVGTGLVAAIVAAALIAPVFTAPEQRRVDLRTATLAGAIEQAMTATIAAAYGAGTTLPDSLPSLGLDAFGSRFTTLDEAGMLDEVAAVSLVQPVAADDLDTVVGTWDPSVRDALDLRLGTGPDHLVLTHTWPFDPNRAAIGLDLLDIPDVRDVARAALDDANIGMTGPYQLVQETDDQLAAITYLPLFDAGDDTVAVLTVVVRHQALLDRWRLPAPGIRDEIVHVDSGTLVAASGEPAGRLSSTHRFELYGQRWEVRTSGDPRPRTSLGRNAFWLLPTLIGLSAAAGIGLVVSRRSARLARAMADERTVELRRANQQLAEADRVKDELLAAVAHDVRAPLTAIGGLARTIETRPDDASLVTSAMPRVVRQVERLDELIGDLLTLASGHDPHHTEVQPIDLVALASRTVADLGIGTVTASVDHAPVRAAPRDLQRIIDNLVTNASRHGRPPVVVEVDRDDRAATLVVRDHGPGVAPEVADTIFDAFQQVGRRRDGGVGLGLTIALRLAHANGGDLRYEDAPGGGARFVLRLPLHTDDTDDTDGADDTDDGPHLYGRR